MKELGEANSAVGKFGCGILLFVFGGLLLVGLIATHPVAVVPTIVLIVLLASLRKSRRK